MADGNQERTASANTERRELPDRRVAARRQDLRRNLNGSGEWDGAERRVAQRRAEERRQEERRNESQRNKAIASWWSG